MKKTMTRTLAAVSAAAVLCTGVLAGPAFAAPEPTVTTPATEAQRQVTSQLPVAVTAPSLAGYRGKLETLLEELVFPEEITADSTEARRQLEGVPVESYVRGLDNDFEVSRLQTSFGVHAVDTSATRAALDDAVTKGPITVNMATGEASVDLGQVVNTIDPDDYEDTVKRLVDEAVPDFDDHRQAAIDAFWWSYINIHFADDVQPVAVMQMSFYAPNDGTIPEMMAKVPHIADGPVDPELEPFMTHEYAGYGDLIGEQRADMEEIIETFWQVITYHHLNSIKGFLDRPFQAEGLAKANTEAEAEIVAKILAIGDPWELTDTDKPTIPGTPSDPKPENPKTPGKPADPKPEDPKAPEKPVAPKPVVLKDNTPGSAFYVPVQWMVQNGITAGYANGTFGKSDNVTRGQTAAFLYRHAGGVADVPVSAPFSDVNVGGANFNAISWMAKQGISSGDTQGNFAQSKSVTRGEFAAFLYRAAQPDHTAPATSPFTDVKAGGANYDAITWLAAERITVGTKSGTFNQSALITRGEMAALLHRFDVAVGR